MTIVLIAIVVPAILYIALSLPSVQDSIRRRCQTELTDLLGVKVEIGDLGIKPFNRATLRRVVLVNDGDTILTLKRLGAGIDLYDFISTGKIAINYAEIIGLKANIARDSAGVPLNIQPIIDALSKKDPAKPPKRFDVRVNTVVIRQSDISYDIKSTPALENRFDPNHVGITDLKADITIPRIKNDDISIDLKRLAFSEKSGLTVSDLEGCFHIDDNSIDWARVSLSTPKSVIALADNSAAINSIKNIKSAFEGEGVAIEILPRSHVYLPDLAPFAAIASDFDITAAISLKAKASTSQLKIDDASLVNFADGFIFNVAGVDVGHPLTPDSLNATVKSFTLKAKKSMLAGLSQISLSEKTFNRLPSQITIHGKGKATALNGRLDGVADVDDKKVKFEASFSRQSPSAPITLAANVNAQQFDLAALTGDNEMGSADFEINAKAAFEGQTKADFDLTLSNFTYRRHSYDAIDVVGRIDGGDFNLSASVLDQDATIESQFAGSLAKGAESVTGNAEIITFNPYALNLTDRYEGYNLTGLAEIDMAGISPDRADGSVSFSDMKFSSDGQQGINIDNFTVISSSRELPRQIEIQSDFINGTVEGDFTFKTLTADLADIFYRVFPALDFRPTLSPRELAAKASPMSPSQSSKASNVNLLPTNDFHFSFKLNETEPYREFLHMPVSIVYPATIEGVVNGREQYAQLTLDLPFLSRNNKLIENTNLVAMIDGRRQTDNFYLTTQMPTKNGPMALMMDAAASSNHIDSSIRWEIDRKRQYEGDIKLSADFSRDEDNQLVTNIGIHRSQLVFNDSIWTIHPARIIAKNKIIAVNDINVSRANQFVKIDGTVSDSPDDLLTVDVLNLNLDYIFESIGIDKVMLGGDATGTIFASELLSSSPHIVTDGIDVENISYNKCVLGDAVVKSHWDMESKAVVIDGTINQENGSTSKVEGEIYALSDSLDIRLIADKVNVGFMETYMSAFASDISGIGTGQARLWGSFKDIDMAGDLYVDNLRLKLNFTNTYFLASDSIHITPGLIKLRDITISDPQGHTATLNGVVAHKFFRAPTFNFQITDARDLLVYDEPSKQNPDWYGRIFVNGGATIDGTPELVKIGVDVTTAPNSIFTFVLSELEEADEYTFITFRDKNRLSEKVEIEEDVNMGTVNRIRAMLAKQQEEESADYEIELRVGINPQAEIDLVMDPVAGDKIRSRGSGNLRMVYTSADNDLRMFGTYTLDQGFYNFTLQDIIIKDFTIKEGSSIAFTGDPLVAKLDIQAVYALNANLSDLDESFLQDKDLNRTNVPVHAILKVDGDIQQPEISFDLEFPTLNQDTYRKVRSIVSTEEMMNRQIIYLLALNRFYTPDYMASTTKGNELFSVASSTLSSQLSSMLGQLSDNWAIAPNLRSDRGDFSDVEVDLALSSRLLNNRLLLNGNFGYRDKSLNNNQFIGDFDLQYLLNRSGSIRLKAYNHYNDQNYYLRTANTTQGVGVMFKRDFDNIFSFLRRMRQKNKSK